MATTFTLWVRDEKLAYDRDLMMAILMKERNNPQYPKEIREYLLGTRNGNLSFDVKRNQKEGGYDIKITLEPIVGALQQVQYEGETYALYEDLQGFLKEIERSKKGLLRTSYEALPGQIHEIFAHVSRWAGADSRELHAVTSGRVFCGKCGVGFKENMIGNMILLSQYKNVISLQSTKVPTECPKCRSTVLLYQYRV